MTYRPQRDTPRDRVRAVAGDTADPPILTGGEASYDAIIAGTASEHLAAQAACRDLAGQLSKSPDQLGSNGSSIAWRERVSYLIRVADGTIPTGLEGDPALAPPAGAARTPASGDVSTQAVW